MKIADILPQLTIQPLRRFGDAWGVTPITSGQRNVVEQAILGDLHRIDAEEAVRGRLTALEQKLDYVRRANAEMVLRLIVDQPAYIVADGFEFTRMVADRDSVFLGYARSSNALRHVDSRTVDICQSVLEVAWEDRVTYDESRLIGRLEEKLGVCRRDHLVMEARVSQRSPITTQDVDEALKALTYEGFVCQFKHQGCTQVVLPEEIATHLRSTFGVVLQSGAYRNLASKLSAPILRQALESAGQPVVAPKKEVLIDRLVDGDVSPSTLLDQVDDKTLDELLGQFPDEKRLTMRGVKIKHVISNFDRSYVKLLDSAPDDPDKTYYDYLEELASRRYDVLRAASVIKRDQNVDRFFMVISGSFTDDSATRAML